MPIYCSVQGFERCQKPFKSPAGLKQHITAYHQSNQLVNVNRPLISQNYTVQSHLYLTATPCDCDGWFLDKDDPPAGVPLPTEPEFGSFRNKISYRVGNLLFRKIQASAPDIDKLLNLLAFAQGGDLNVSFANHTELYEKIDHIQQGRLTWYCTWVSYVGPLPDNPPSWMLDKHELWYRDTREVVLAQISNPHYKDRIMYAPSRIFDEKGERVFSDLFTGNWVWRQCDKIAENPITHGAMFVPIIYGSNKTVISVATGGSEYHPAYAAAGNLSNQDRKSHDESVTVVAFLPIPKAICDHANTDAFHDFKRHLYHTCLWVVSEPLHEGMTTPQLVQCDNPELTMVSCIVQGYCGRCRASSGELNIPAGSRHHSLTMALMDLTDNRPNVLRKHWGIIPNIMPFTYYFPRVDIHKLLTADIYHQLIKPFRDYIVEWVIDYIKVTYKGRADEVIDNIDQRIAAVPTFLGLRRFPDGRGFKQWTGDDSKALMKVYLPAIAEYLPFHMTLAIQHYLNFCYLARQESVDETMLKCLEFSLREFRRLREQSGLGPLDVGNLPRFHNQSHFSFAVSEFGSLNSLCTSIIESKHIRAVKEPWRRSNRYHALGQMLVTNQQIHQLQHLDLEIEQCWLAQQPLQDGEEADEAEEDTVNLERVEGFVRLAVHPARGYPSDHEQVARRLGAPELIWLVQELLYQRLHPNIDNIPGNVRLPHLTRRICVFHSASAVYYAPTKISGTHGMHRHFIHLTPYWPSHQAPRRDCVYLKPATDRAGVTRPRIAQVMALMEVQTGRVRVPCALVQLFRIVGNSAATGMWIVKRETDWGHPRRTVVPLSEFS